MDIDAATPAAAAPIASHCLFCSHFALPSRITAPFLIDKYYARGLSKGLFSLCYPQAPIGACLMYSSVSHEGIERGTGWGWQTSPTCAPCAALRRTCKRGAPGRRWRSAAQRHQADTGTGDASLHRAPTLWRRTPGHRRGHDHAPAPRHVGPVPIPRHDIRAHHLPWSGTRRTQEANETHYGGDRACVSVCVCVYQAETAPATFTAVLQCGLLHLVDVRPSAHKAAACARVATASATLDLCVVCVCSRALC